MAEGAIAPGRVNMATHKVSELEGGQLDYWVAKAEGKSSPGLYRGERGETFCSLHDSVYHVYAPSTGWADGGPIIERERIAVAEARTVPPSWSAWIRGVPWHDDTPDGFGPTPLIAAMRAYVAAKYGEEVELR
jgi:hypothetical protein